VNTPLRLTAFAVGLVAVFGAAAGIGHAVGPVGATSDPTAGAGHDMGADAPHGSAAPAELPAKGLLVSQDGYTLDLASDMLPAGPAAPVAFRILGPDGSAVTAFDESHDQELHLIAVRRDLTGFQHVHPDLAPDGTWTTPLDLTPGTWRVFADFVPAADGENRTLGADLAVPGVYEPAPVPAQSRTAEVDGFTVTLDGDLVAGEESQLAFTVSRDGDVVPDLQPYLGAAGHLVVLRAGDLAYLHVHPDEDTLSFMTTAPAVGTYRLFVQFKHGDVVHTAAFTMEAAA
jgi:hypothetical protein